MAAQQKHMLTSDKSKLKDVKVSDLSVSPPTPGGEEEDEEDRKEKRNSPHQEKKKKKSP